MNKDKMLLESISFDEIRPMDIIDKESFTIHLKEVFKSLSENNNKYTKGIYFDRFSDLIPDCPVFIAFKFFKSLMTKENSIKSYISLNEFLTGLITLKFGNYEEVAKMIFNIFDFDQNSSIKTDDIKLLISFLPLNENNEKPEYMYQMESLNELDQIIKETFNLETTNIKFNDFLNYIDKKSNIFLMMFCYLYFIIPLLARDIIIKHKSDSKTSDINSKIEDGVHSNLRSKSRKKLVFSYSSAFSPIQNLRQIQRKNTRAEKELKPNRIDTVRLRTIKVKETVTPITKSLKRIGVIPIELKTNSIEENEISINSTNYKSGTKSDTQKSDGAINEELKNLIKNTTIIECSKETSNVDIFSSMIKQELKKKEDENIESNDKETLKANYFKENIKYEGELIMFTKVNGKCCNNFVYLTLIGQSIYYYNDNFQTRDDYYDCNYLPGCFFRENSEEEIGFGYFYSFSIIFPFEVKQFYHKDQEEIQNWIKHLREVLSYKDFFEFYRLGDTIGKGEYGVIKTGFDKKSNEKVAIKILNKAKIKKQDQLILIRTEIAIMKLSKHPNIIKFIANYENSEYIFIVMELVKSGNLNQYLEKNKHNINEKMAANMCYQIANALIYLHKYGIIHRDLKPDNILLKITNSKGDLIKESTEVILMDFGLSKILGNSETTKEGYGTIAYIAPEVLMRRPYNYKVDIWSLGIIIYHILSGEIPFMFKCQNLGVMLLRICKEDIKFSKKFENISSDAIDLIKRCLQKNADKRISIEEVVNHNWFRSNK